MSKKTLMTIATLFSLSLGGLVQASESFDLRCDSDTFEAPMTVTARDGVAKVDVQFDEAGSAIIDADYSRLAVIDLGDELTITQPVVAGRRPHFHVTLRRSSSGKLVGTLYALSTDGTDVPYEGEISCSYESR